MPQTPPANRTALVIGGGIAGPTLAMAVRRAGIDAVVYEARSAAADDAGAAAFLNLAPNGVNALKALDIDIESAVDGFPVTGIAFFNGDGKRLGELDGRGEKERYGARSVILKRALLHRALRDEAIRRGIAIEFGKKLAAIEAGGEGAVIARFADGTAARGDVLLGCDGLHSRTRQIILPDAPRPSYTGIVDSGGFARPAPPLPSSGAMEMTFGKRAFFGSLAKPDGEVYWFSNVAWPEEPMRDELAAISSDAWRTRLLDLHRDDPAPIPGVIGTTLGEFGKWPIHDLPSLPTWHKGRVCLVGDAAHATSPHVGQGASTALEDAVVLAKCLRDVADPERAFATYERLRKERVEKLVKQARRTGQQKAVANPIARRLRDLMLPLFLKLGAKSTTWVYSYNVDWDERVA